MRIRRDGSIQSGAIPTPANVEFKLDFSLMRAMVTAVNYVDAPGNISELGQSPRVTYDVVVLGGHRNGFTLSGCRLSAALSGNNNYHEVTLRPASKPLLETPLEQQDGDIVFVQFLDGRKEMPIIVGKDQGLATLDQIGAKVGAKASEGPREVRMYNGIYQEIDNLGNLTWVRHGGAKDPALETFVPAAEENVKLEVKPELVTLTFKSGLTVTLNGTQDLATILTKAGLKVTVDGPKDLATIVTKKQTRLSIDGAADDIKLTTQAGAKVDVLGSSGTIHAKDNGNGALKITGNKVAIGASSAELLQQISNQLQQMQTALNALASHTHIGNLGYPTAPPDVAAAVSGAATQLGTIKALVDGIKGTL